MRESDFGKFTLHLPAVLGSKSAYILEAMPIALVQLQLQPFPRSLVGLIHSPINSEL